MRLGDLQFGRFFRILEAEISDYDKSSIFMKLDITDKNRLEKCKEGTVVVNICSGYADVYPHDTEVLQVSVSMQYTTTIKMDR